jgi:hypothetical protein
MELKSKLKNVLIGSMAGLLLMLTGQTIAVNAGSSSDAAVTRFITDHRWADDNAKEMLVFIYYNVPNSLKERVLAKYGEALSRETTAPSRERIIQLTTSLMPPEMKSDIKSKLNAEMQKFVLYQNSKKK